MNAQRPIGRALDLVYVVDARTSADDAHIAAVLRAGVTSLWLRAHDLDGGALVRAAAQLRERCVEAGAHLIVGGRADVALAVGADGVQLGYRSPPPARVRDWFPGWIGVSCHDAAELEQATHARADFAMLSPVFPTPRKGAALGIAAFAHLCDSVDLPVVALGGINATNAGEARAHGASGVAVLRALRDADDPVPVAQALLGRRRPG